MRRLSVIPACLLVGLVGCQHNSNPSASGSKTPSIAATLGMEPKTAPGPFQPNSTPTPPPSGYAPSNSGEPGTKMPGSDLIFIDPLGNLHTGNPSHQVHDLPPLPSKDWTPTTAYTAAQLAERMDTSFRSIRMCDLLVNLHFILPIGEGTMKCESKFGDPNKCAIQYPIVGGEAEHLHPQSVEFRLNGGKMTTYHPEKGTKDAFTPVAEYTSGGAEDGQMLLQNWPSDMPRLAFSHYLDGKDVYVPLIQALSRPDSGYTVQCQERTTELNSKRITDYRIVAERKADPAKNIAAAQFEIIIDARHFVPVTMRSHLVPGHEKPATVIEWHGQWKDLEKVDPSDFSLPGQSA